MEGDEVIPRTLEVRAESVWYSHSSPCYLRRERETGQTRGKRVNGRGERDAAEFAIGSRLGGENDTTTAGRRRLSAYSDKDAADFGAPFVGRAA